MHLKSMHTSDFRNEKIILIELDVPLETSLRKQGWSEARKNTSLTFMAYVYTLCTTLCFDEALFITWQRSLKKNVGQSKLLFIITRETTGSDNFK